MRRKESGPIIERGFKASRAGAAFLSILASVASGGAFAGPTPEQQRQVQFVADREALWEDNSQKVNCERAEDYARSDGLTPIVMKNLQFSCPAPIAARIIKENSTKRPVKKTGN